MPAKTKQLKKLERNPKKILIVTEYFPPHWTGLAQSIYYAAHSLADKGCEVRVLTTHFDPSSSKNEFDNGVNITRVPFQFKISRTHYSYIIVWVFIRMVSQFDEVIINSPNSNILFFAIIAKLFGKKLSIYHQADILMPRQTGSIIKHRLIELLFDIFTIPSMKMADTLSSFTQDYAAFSRVMRYGLKKFKPYIPDVRLPKGKPSLALKKSLDSLKKRHMLIGISGRFVEEKGYDILFQALPLVIAQQPEAHIVFAGQKTLAYEPFYEKHKKLFESQKNHVTFLGLLHGGDLSYFYASLDVFVLSSRIECFALTQIEAVEKKVPIVVTDVAGARMLVKESGFGEIAERENAESLAEKIVMVLKNRGSYLPHHKKAVAFLEKYHDFPQA